MNLARSIGVIAVGSLLSAGLALPATTSPAAAEPVYTAIDQSQMSIVDVSSVEESAEAPNGAAALVLDGNKETYWHTKWAGGVDPMPHHLTIELGDEAVDLGRVVLTPRQSSNGSGRVAQYSIQTAESCEADFTEVAKGDVAAETDPKADVVIDFDAVAARCVKVVYNASWGGNNTPEKVATLAEFNAFSVTDDGTEPVEPTEPAEPTDPTPAPGPEIVVPDGAPELSADGLSVRLHPDFPQVVDYRLGDAQLAGKLGDPLTQVTIDEKPYDVTVAAPTVTGASATYV